MSAPISVINLNTCGFETLLRNLSKNVIAHNLCNICNFLRGNNDELEFCNTTENEEEFLLRIARNTDVLLSQRMNGLYGHYCTQIKDLIRNKNLTIACVYKQEEENVLYKDKEVENKKYLLYKKLYNASNNMTQGLASIEPSSRSASMSRSSSVDSLSSQRSNPPTANRFISYCLHLMLNFVKHETQLSLEFSGLDKDDAKLIHTVFSSAIDDNYDNGIAFKNVYLTLWTTMKIFSLDFEFRIKYLKSSLDTKSLLLEKQPRGLLPVKIKSDSTDVKNEFCVRQPRMKAKIKKKHLMYLDKVCPDFIISSLKKMVNFLSDDEQASMVISVSSVEEKRFLKNIIDFSRSSKTIKEIFEDEPRNILEEVNVLMDTKTNFRVRVFGKSKNLKNGVNIVKIPLFKHPTQPNNRPGPSKIVATTSRSSSVDSLSSQRSLLLEKQPRGLLPVKIKSYSTDVTDEFCVRKPRMKAILKKSLIEHLTYIDKVCPDFIISSLQKMVNFLSDDEQTKLLISVSSLEEKRFLKNIINFSRSTKIKEIFEDEPRNILEEVNVLMDTKTNFRVRVSGKSKNLKKDVKIVKVPWFKHPTQPNNRPGPSKIVATTSRSSSVDSLSSQRSLLLEKQPRGLLPVKIKSDSTDVTDEFCVRQPRMKAKIKKELIKHLMYLDKVCPDFIISSLKKMVNFLSDDEQASMLISVSSQQEKRFLKNIIDFSRSKKIKEIFEDEPRNYLEEVNVLMDTKTNFSVRVSGKSKNLKKGVKIVKVPLFKHPTQPNNRLGPSKSVATTSRSSSVDSLSSQRSSESRAPQRSSSVVSSSQRSSLLIDISDEEKVKKSVNSLRRYIDNVCPDFVISSLKKMVDFLSDDEQASMVISVSSTEEKRFVEKMLSYSLSHNIKGALVEEPRNLLEKVNMLTRSKQNFKVKKIRMGKGVNIDVKFQKIPLPLNPTGPKRSRPWYHRVDVPRNRTNVPKNKYEQTEAELEQAACSTIHSAWDAFLGPPNSNTDDQSSPAMRNKAKTQKITILTSNTDKRLADAMMKYEFAKLPQLDGTRRKNINLRNLQPRKRRYEIRNEQLIEAFSVPVNSDKAMKMMLSMGWTGGALGARGEGITEPIMPSLNTGSGAGLGHVDEKKSNFKPKIKISPTNPEVKKADFKPRNASPVEEPNVVLPTAPMPVVNAGLFGPTVQTRPNKRTASDFKQQLLTQLLEFVTSNSSEKRVLDFSPMIHSKEKFYAKTVINGFGWRSDLNNDGTSNLVNRIMKVFLKNPELVVTGCMTKDKRQLILTKIRTKTPRMYSEIEKYKMIDTLTNYDVAEFIHNYGPLFYSEHWLEEGTFKLGYLLQILKFVRNQSINTDTIDCGMYPSSVGAAHLNSGVTRINSKREFSENTLESALSRSIKKYMDYNLAISWNEDRKSFTVTKDYNNRSNPNEENSTNNNEEDKDVDMEDEED